MSFPWVDKQNLQDTYFGKTNKQVKVIFEESIYPKFIYYVATQNHFWSNFNSDVALT